MRYELSSDARHLPESAGINPYRTTRCTDPPSRIRGFRWCRCGASSSPAKFPKRFRWAWRSLIVRDSRWSTAI